jgi:hypothetical protein
MTPDYVIDHDVDLALDRAFERWPLLRFTKSWNTERGANGVLSIHAVSRASGEKEEVCVERNVLGRMPRAEREVILDRATQTAAETLSRRLPAPQRMIAFNVWSPMPASIDVGKEIAPAIRTVQFEPVGVTLDILTRAIDAVILCYGDHPTHLLVGWQTYLELKHYHSWALEKENGSGEEGTVRFRDVPLRIDPTREQVVVAVPPVEYFIGNPLPNGAVWEPKR